MNIIFESAKNLSPEELKDLWAEIGAIVVPIMPLDELKSAYAEIGRTITRQLPMNNVLKLNTWFIRNRRNKYVRYVYHPKTKTGNSSCTLIVKELSGEQRIWNICVSGPNLSEKELRFKASDQAVAEMEAMGVEF